VERAGKLPTSELKKAKRRGLRSSIWDISATSLRGRSVLSTQEFLVSASLDALASLISQRARENPNQQFDQERYGKHFLSLLFKGVEHIVTDSAEAGQNTKVGGPPFRVQIVLHVSTLGASSLSAFFADRVGATSKGTLDCPLRHPAMGDSISTTPSIPVA
jgi:hypothetical protein